MNPGGQVRCGHARSGARCYLCVRGGIAVPLLQGSASTHLLTGLGGLEGRALKRGDVLTVGSAGASVPLGTAAPPRPHPTIRVTALGDCLPLCEPTWQVAENSNRMGLRLRGPALASNPGRMLTEGVPLGAIQVPPDGQPIILFVEHQTTGATRKIANVISRPTSTTLDSCARAIRFVSKPSPSTPRSRLLREQERWLRALV